MIVYGCLRFLQHFWLGVCRKVRPEIAPMMTNGFGCITGGIVSGKVVEYYTQNVPTVANRVAHLRRLLAGAGLCVRSLVQNTNTFAFRQVRNPSHINSCPVSQAG